MSRNYVTHFCGLGGACWGLEQAGLKCNLAIDNDGDGPAVETRAFNLKCNKGLVIDVREYFKGYPLKPEHIREEHRKDLFLFWTSPPCKKFSMANKGSPKDLEMENLYKASLEFASWARPRFVVVENVLGLLRHEAEAKDTAEIGKLTEMTQAFRDIGYAVDWDVLDAWKFGLPQKRQRVFIVGVLNKRIAEELCRHQEKTGVLTSFFPDYPQNIRHLKFNDIRDRGITDHQLGGKSYLTMMEKLRRCRNLTIKILGAPKCEDTLMPTVTCGFGGGITRKKCAVVDSVETGKDHVTFLRHPTLKEGLRAQGFPDDWMLPDNESLAWNLVGNAVPSPVSKAIAEHLKALEDWAERGYEGPPPASKAQWHRVHRLDEITCEKKMNIPAECPFRPA